VSQSPVPKPVLASIAHEDETARREQEQQVVIDAAKEKSNGAQIHVQERAHEEDDMLPGPQGH